MNFNKKNIVSQLDSQIFRNILLIMNFIFKKSGL